MPVLQERDRKLHGMSYFQSRSAQIGIRKSLSTQSIANDCQKYFIVCLDRDHAMNLFDYAFTKQNTKQSKISQMPVRFQTLPVRTEKNLNAQLERVKLMTDLTNEGMTFGVVDLCVTVNLCKPEQYSTYVIEIYNGDTRTHSNLPDDTDPGVSCVRDNKADDNENDDDDDGDDLVPWCPYTLRYRPDSDFVEIRNTSCARKLCIEGMLACVSFYSRARVYICMH